MVKSTSDTNLEKLISKIFQSLEAAITEVGIEEGMDPGLIEKLWGQTKAGTMEMLNQNGFNCRELIKAVSSPGGTTEAALEVFERGNMKGLIKDIIKKANE